jgi:hypothetical protein
MNIIELYKMHINKNADGAEIHKLFCLFGIEGIVIFNLLNEEDNKDILKNMQNRRNLCIQWILKNSKLKSIIK